MALARLSRGSSVALRAGRTLATAHRPLAAGESEARVRMLQPMLNERKKPEERTNRASLAAAAGLSLAGAAMLGYEFAELIFSARTVGAALLVAGGAVGVHGAGWFARTKGEARAAGAGDPGSGGAAYTFRLLNPTSRFGGAAASLDTLCARTSAKFPAEVDALLKAAREREDAERQAALEQRSAALLERVRGALSPPAPPPAGEAAVASTAEGVAPVPTSCSDLLGQLAPRLFVLEYKDPSPLARSAAQGGAGARDGRTRAELFGEEVSLLLSLASPHDEVLISLTSPGGRVSEFGLAASHLLRLKQARIRTTVAVDTIAASGGYMLAVCADRIVAAPFAFIGSIGVVAELPNVHRLLTRADVDYLLFTAGKFKRTVTVFSQNTDEGKAKFQEDLERIHEAFKRHIAQNRQPGLDLDEVATGEAWLATEARRHGLVDELCTSHDVVLDMAARGFDVVEIRRKPPPRSLHSLFDRFVALPAALEHALGGALARALSAMTADGAVHALSATLAGAAAPARDARAPAGTASGVLDALDSSAQLSPASAAESASTRAP
ncbi:hypothetical protein KFE25_008552 [Diacronema lutheri]|uniref:Peptidase S49 domain-containing protein n=1 Tax=Diacronema lutheri TaxID=2081491 RepID=A0A8J5XW61_DIALT|nr:hypothetical protein KFE25_008552 [Diacronema lutheri]